MQSELVEVPEIPSSWDDLAEGVTTQTDWRERRRVLIALYLDLILDQHKPGRPVLDLQNHENVVVHKQYERKLLYGGLDSHLKPPEATKRNLVTDQDQVGRPGCVFCPEPPSVEEPEAPPVANHRLRWPQPNQRPASFVFVNTLSYV